MQQTSLEMSGSKQRKRNVRLGLILASVAFALFVGFVAKIALLGSGA